MDAGARAVLDALGEGVTIHDADGEIMAANRAAREILGLSRSELVSRSYRSPRWSITTLDGRPIPPDDLPAARAIEDGRAVWDERIVVDRPDDDPVVLSVNAVPLGADAPDGWEAAVSFRDIGEQVELEEDLRRREQRFDRILTEISDVVTVLSDDGTIRYESPSIERVFGYDPEELVGRPAFDLVHPEDVDGVAEAFFAATEGRSAPQRTVQYRFRRADGAWRLVESTGVVPEDEELGPVIVTRDVTDRVQAQRKFRAIFETTPSPVVLARMEEEDEGELLEVNHAFTELFGYSREEAVGSNTAELGLWARPGQRELVLARLGETGRVDAVEAEMQDADGHRLDVLISGSLLEMGGERYVVGVAQDISERKAFERTLERQALHDPLTGLPNRTLLTDRIEQGVARARREDEPLGLLMLDIDQFKRINDRLGHTAGDQVLTQFARRLEGAIREEDTLARWGGDEFFLLLPGLEEPVRIAEVPERLRRALRAPFEAGGESIHLDVTMGAVVYSGSDRPRAVRTDDPEELIRFGSLALHWAREGSSAGFELFDPDAEVEGSAVIRQERELREAVEAGQLVPHFQPLVRLADGAMVGIEALVRWQHPERGLLPPSKFLALAEELGLIGDLGKAVLRRACAEVAGWADGEPGAEVPWIAFNLSGRQFGDPDLARKLERWVAESGLRPEQVTLEVTETSLMQVPARIDELRAAGFRIFADDFGTGYSTFAYLRNLELDGLKIDMSFVQGLTESDSDVALVETMLTLGERLDLEVVAEGIETESQRRKLETLGCELGQGFHFARPMPPAAMADRWREGTRRED